MAVTAEIDFTRENLAALTQAIASGARRVKYTDKEITYNSMKDMIALRELMKKELGITSDTSGRKYASTSKGFS